MKILFKQSAKGAILVAALILQIAFTIIASTLYGCWQLIRFAAKDFKTLYFDAIESFAKLKEVKK